MGSAARVTERGQLVVASFSFDLTEFRALDAEDTAFNFFAPIGGEQFVITGVIVKASRTVSTTTDATVVLYEAGAADSIVVDKAIFQGVFVRGDLIQVLPLNILTNPGKWINAKTTDATMNVNVIGFFVPTL